MQCLVLNASYEPMKPLPTKTVIRLVLQGKADVLESDPTQVFRSERGNIEAPLVIRLRKHVKIPRNLVRKVTNTFLFARDNYQCQYCGRMEAELTGRECLNRDHVQPQSRGGENTWENCVTSCSRCNSKKDNRTPYEAGMKLLRKPVVPDTVLLRWQVRKLTPLQMKYVKLFYGDDFLTHVV